MTFGRQWNANENRPCKTWAEKTGIPCKPWAPLPLGDTMGSCPNSVNTSRKRNSASCLPKETRRGKHLQSVCKKGLALSFNLEVQALQNINVAFSIHSEIKSNWRQTVKCMLWKTAKLPHRRSSSTGREKKAGLQRHNLAALFSVFNCWTDMFHIR